MRAGARPVVVGVDGSEDSLLAARFGAGEARDRGAPLLLVHALTWPFERVHAGAPDGCTAHAVLQRTPCPVAVVPVRARAR